MKAVLGMVAALALSACAGLGGQAMSPEQISANAKDKNAVVACGNGSGPWGRVITVYVDTNKINDNQAVQVDENCKVNVIGTKRPELTQ